ncbi:hypothetical protein NP284_03675 [Rhodopseudomonas pseudopalustris]
MTLMLSKIKSGLVHESEVLHGNQSPEAGRARAALSDFQMELNDAAKSLNDLNMPFMIASLIGAVVNWFALIWASFSAQRPLTSTEEWLLTGLSVGWFLFVGAAVALAALIYLLPLHSKLNRIRSSV